MKFIRKLLCGEQQLETYEEKQQEEKNQSKTREEEIREKADLIRDEWYEWPEREESEESRTVRQETIEIPVYELEVTYDDGDKEVYEHQSFYRPNLNEINEIRKVDVEDTTYFYSENSDGLYKSRSSYTTVASFNRDKIRNVKIIGKRNRVVEVEYELVTTKIEEQRGSAIKRELMEDLEWRRRHRMRTRLQTEPFWKNPTTEREALYTLVARHGIPSILEKITSFDYEAEKIEVLT